MKIEYIYGKLKCGGIGYADILLRVKDKYYTIVGHECPEEYHKLLNRKDIIYNRRRKNGHSLWCKHRCDNEITAKDFLSMLEHMSKDLPYRSLFLNNLEKYVYSDQYKKDKRQL